MTKSSSDVVERFFIDHGMIHDRVTGKHVDTQPVEYEEGQFDSSPVTETCALLNEQHATIERLSAERLQLREALVEARQFVEKYAARGKQDQHGKQLMLEQIDEARNTAEDTRHD